jgi:hypothetical protein
MRGNRCSEGRRVREVKQINEVAEAQGARLVRCGLQEGGDGVGGALDGARRA